MRLTNTLAVAVALLVAGGCGRTPTTPSAAQSPPVAVTPAPSPPSDGPWSPADGPFEVTGVVTDEQGVPVADAEVTMGHYEDWLTPYGIIVQTLRRPATRTDGSGRYAITFSAVPLPGSSFVARADIHADGYDQYWLNLRGPVRNRVENFRLLRIKRIVAGETIAVAVSRDNGECTGWLYSPCGRFRVTAPSGGNLTIEAVATDNRAARPAIEACCVGDEQYGNPLTMHVDAGSETWVQIGQSDSGLFAAPTVLVKTSLKPD